MSGAASAAAIVVNSYSCACDRQAVSPSGEGLPAGWQRKVINGVNGIQTVVVCPDCAFFEEAEESKRKAFQTGPDLSNGKLVRALAAIHKAGPNMAADCRTHDSTSAIDDEPNSPRPLAGGDRSGPGIGTLPRTRLWQLKLIFHGDKGAVESSIIVGATDPLAATDIARQIDRFRLSELVSVIVTPAPLDLPLIDPETGV